MPVERYEIDDDIHDINSIDENDIPTLIANLMRIPFPYKHNDSSYSRSPGTEHGPKASLFSVV